MEYDPLWSFNDTATMQHYELYNVSADIYQMHNIYQAASADQKQALHAELDKYWHCGSLLRGSIMSGVVPHGESNCP